MERIEGMKPSKNSAVPSARRRREREKKTTGFRERKHGFRERKHQGFERERDW